MLISLRAKIAYLAMPKTGSTAVEAALAPHCDVIMSRNPAMKHIRLRKFERFIRPLLNNSGAPDVETTAMVREPLDWLASWYRYRGRPELEGHPNSSKSMSFEQFLIDYFSDNPPSPARIGRPSKFAQPTEAGVSINHLYRYDHMENFTAFLSTRFDAQILPDRINVSPTRDIALSRAVRLRLENALAADYELYESAL